MEGEVHLSRYDLYQYGCKLLLIYMWGPKSTQPTALPISSLPPIRPSLAKVQTQRLVQMLKALAGGPLRCVVYLPRKRRAAVRSAPKTNPPRAVQCDWTQRRSDEGLPWPIFDHSVHDKHEVTEAPTPPVTHHQLRGLCFSGDQLCPRVTSGHLRIFLVHLPLAVVVWYVLLNDLRHAS